jgi:hypothetical protein
MQYITNISDDDSESTMSLYMAVSKQEVSKTPTVQQISRVQSCQL